MTAPAVTTSSRLFENGITDFLETGRRGPKLATQAMLCTAATVTVVAGKVEAVAEKMADEGDSTDEAVEAPTRTGVARPRLLVAMTAAPKPPAEVLQCASVIGVAGRAIERVTAWRSYATDAKDGGTLPMPAPRPWIDEVDATDGHGADVCPSSKEEAFMAVANEVGARDDDQEEGTFQASDLNFQGRRDRRV